MKKLAIVLALVLAVGLPALLWAQGGGSQGSPSDDRYGGPGMMGGMMGMMGMMDGGMMGGGMMGGMGLMGFGPDLFDRAQQMLTLTDDQVTRLRNLWLEFVRASATPRANLQVARAELQNLMSARTVNLAQVETRVRDIARLRGDLDLAEARFAVQAKGLLTPEQQQRLRSFDGAGPWWERDGRGQAPGARGPGGMMGPGDMMGNPQN